MTLPLNPTDRYVGGWRVLSFPCGHSFLVA